MYRYNPDLIKEGKNPLQLDYKEPSIPVKDYAYNETRYRMLLQADEARAEMLLKEAQADVTSTGNTTSKWPPCTIQPQLTRMRKNPSDAQPCQVNSPGKAFLFVD